MTAIYPDSYCCFRYHKGTDFQANHNPTHIVNPLRVRCFRYHKGTDFQANHNEVAKRNSYILVVLDTTKVQIFKQITTSHRGYYSVCLLFQIPQRYRFSSKSQQKFIVNSCNTCCFRYHKGTDFQANHNTIHVSLFGRIVVLDTTKVQIFKQITTARLFLLRFHPLFQIPQRYRFSSKSQRI